MVNCQIATFKGMKILEGGNYFTLQPINLDSRLLLVASNQPQTPPFI